MISGRLNELTSGWAFQPPAAAERAARIDGPPARHPAADSVRTQGELMETQSAAQKPQPVVTAINLLWASLAVGLVKMLMDFSYLSGVAPAAFTNFVLIFTFALIAFLIFKISAGRNWARITFLVICIIGVLPTLPIVLVSSLVRLLLGCSLWLKSACRFMRYFYCLPSRVPVGFARLCLLEF